MECPSVPQSINPEIPQSPNFMPLRIGFIGSGFNARFHMQSFTGVRHAEVMGVWSPNHRRAGEAAALARKLDIGRPVPTTRSPRWWPIQRSMLSGSAGRITPGSKTSRRSWTRSTAARGS